MVDKAGDPVPDMLVRLIADPAGYSAEARGSWLHSLAFRQRMVTSARGSARFTGVPPGRIIVRVKTPTSATKHRGGGGFEPGTSGQLKGAVKNLTGNNGRTCAPAGSGRRAWLADNGGSTQDQARLVLGCSQ